MILEQKGHTSRSVARNMKNLQVSIAYRYQKPGIEVEIVSPTEKYAYLSTSTALGPVGHGVLVLDITDPTNPTLVDDIRFPFLAVVGQQEMKMALILAVGAGLMIRSFGALNDLFGQRCTIALFPWTAQ